MPREVWMPVVGWPYEVSDRGRVRRVGRVKYSKWPDGHILTAKIDDVGYLRVSLSHVDGRQRPFRIHALVCRAFHGQKIEGQEVRHLDGNKLNNVPSNLCWGYPKENRADCFAHGVHPCGEQHVRASLSNEQVREIRRRHCEALHGRSRVSPGFLDALATEMGTSKTVVRSILHGGRWAHA